MVIVEEEKALIARIKGDINLVVAGWLKDELLEKLSGSEKENLIIDLKEVALIDSSGIGALISVYKKIEERKGKLFLLNVQPYVKKILNFARLDRVFSLSDDEKDILKNLQ